MAHRVRYGRRLAEPPVRLACLECRSCKVRCDGQDPCNNCLRKSKYCEYKASQRGGLRKRRKTQEPENGAVTMGTLGNVTTRSGSYTEAFHNLSMPETLLQNLDMPISPFTLNADDTQHVGDVSSAATMHQFITQGESLPVRVYDSGSNILNAYYLFIHPFLPLLPPPGAEEQVDSPAQFALSTASLSTFRGDHLPSYSDSPLFMALAAILALIPLSEEHQGITTHSAALIRRSVAHMYAEKAMYFVDEDLGRPISMPIGSVSDLVNWPRPRDSIHPHTPVQLESLLALLILSQYEYCQRGNLCKMRARANQAMTQAMDMGLHRIEDDHEFLEAKRRAWWMTVYVMYQSSILQNLTPHLENTSQTTTSYPRFNVSSEPWELYIKATKIYFTASHLSKSMNFKLDVKDVSQTTQSQFDDLDLELRNMLSASYSVFIRDINEPIEGHVARNMWHSIRAVLHSARLRLHRLTAFSDHAIFLSQHCDLTAIAPPATANVSSDIIESQMLRSLQVQDSGENHDDTFAHAMTASKICMASALGVTQCLSALVQPVEYIDVTLRSSLSFSPRPLPYFACCAMQSAYTLLVLLYTLQGALASGNCEKYRDILSSTEPGLESVEIERLVHELRHGICDLLHVMDHSFPIFEGVAAMLEEVRSAYDIDDYKGVFGMGN